MQYFYWFLRNLSLLIIYYDHSYRIKKLKTWDGWTPLFFCLHEKGCQLPIRGVPVKLPLRIKTVWNPDLQGPHVLSTERFRNGNIQSYLCHHHTSQGRRKVLSQFIFRVLTCFISDLERIQKDSCFRTILVQISDGWIIVLT